MMRVLKFGGSSVATSDRIRDVQDIILDAVKEVPIVVVVSAFQGVSNKLIKCADMAAKGDENYQLLYRELSNQHYQMIQELLPVKNEEIINQCNQLLLELNEILQGIFLIRELTAAAIDHISSFGERLSASIIAAFINKNYETQYVDARHFIFTDNQHTAANVLTEQTNAAIAQYYNEHFLNKAIIPIVTGFIGSTLDGRTTTLGRNSSDYSATIIGAALSATRIEIWTDVDGVFSADPNLVPNAFILPYLSYLEAIELSYFGGKVVHALTFKPLLGNEIPILIKNTMNPNSPGTYIVAQSSSSNMKNWMAKTVTTVNDITLLILKNNHSTDDVSHLSERLFRSLALAHIQTFLIMESSPKHSIYIAIKHTQLEHAQKTIEQAFHLEFKHNLINLEEKPAQCLIAIVGEEMRKLPPETAGKMFMNLGRIGININAIVHGASERNVCLVIDKVHHVRALNLIHQAFFVKHKNLAVLLIGAGRVGAALLQHLLQEQQALLKKQINLTVCAISDSKKMISNVNGINLAKYKNELLYATEPFEAANFLKLIPRINSNNIAVIDCTASDDIVETYPAFIKQGVHIITPNKRANVLPYSQYKSLMEQFKRHHTYFLCRTNVGAGLPVLTILKDLLDCGDTIIKIEGIFSGTLSYIFNHYDGKIPFSRVLQKAHQLQLTEPDPREDLSGMDVGRKLLIMARHMGWKLELSDIPVENLVPEALRAGVFSEKFFDAFETYDSIFKTKLDQAKADKKVLRYVGAIDVKTHTISARLEEIPDDHPLALACDSDNIISFTTHHYQKTPLVVRGPGAGVECTALGVFSDILKLMSNLPE